MNREEKYKQALEFERKIEKSRDMMIEWYNVVYDEDEIKPVLSHIKKEEIKIIELKHKKLAGFFEKEKNQMEQELKVKINLKENTTLTSPLITITNKQKAIKKRKKSLNKEIKALRREIEECEERIYKCSDEFYHEVYMIGLEKKLKKEQINPNNILYMGEDKNFYFFKTRDTGDYVHIKKR